MRDDADWWREMNECKAPKEFFDDEPERDDLCEHCGLRAVKDEDALYCDDCNDDLAQQQVEDRLSEPPMTMDEMHRAAWHAKHR